MDKKERNAIQKEALLFTRIEDLKVQCSSCWHLCKIPKEKFGRCGTRVNINGTLFCINYGMISSFSINPIDNTITDKKDQARIVVDILYDICLTNPSLN